MSQFCFLDSLSQINIIKSNLISQCVIQTLLFHYLSFKCLLGLGPKFLYSPYGSLKGCLMPQPDYWRSGYHPFGGFFLFLILSSFHFVSCFIISLFLMFPEGIAAYYFLSSVCTRGSVFLVPLYFIIPVCCKLFCFIMYPNMHRSTGRGQQGGGGTAAPPVTEIFEIFRAKRWWFGRKYLGESILKDSQSQACRLLSLTFALS